MSFERRIQKHQNLIEDKRKKEHDQRERLKRDAEIKGQQEQERFQRAISEINTIAYETLLNDPRYQAILEAIQDPELTEVLQSVASRWTETKTQGTFNRKLINVPVKTTIKTKLPSFERYQIEELAKRTSTERADIERSLIGIMNKPFFFGGNLVLTGGTHEESWRETVWSGGEDSSHREVQHRKTVENRFEIRVLLQEDGLTFRYYTNKDGIGDHYSKESFLDSVSLLMGQGRLFK